MGKYWQLPDGVDELLPPQAGQLETLRRKLLDLFMLWGYDLVLPPMFEFLDALTIGFGDDLSLSTFKVTDQTSGRTLGFRADISSQVARVDARSLPQDATRRFCYAGSVLMARSPASGEGRCPLKVGAELYGHEGLESDIEILMLIAETLALATLPSFHVELGHVRIYRDLIAPLKLTPEQEAQLFEAMQAKSTPDLTVLLSQWQVPATTAELLAALPNLMGGRETLVKARTLFAKASDTIHSALDELESIALELERRIPALALTFDLAELRGYCYHTGVIYTAYADEYGQPVAKGGRYDGLGSIFGCARPATGFDADLKTLVRLGSHSTHPAPACILAPWCCEDAKANAELTEEIHALRKAGKRVILELPGTPKPPDCAHLERQDGRWVVQHSHEEVS